MKHFSSFSDLIDQWPGGRSAFAADIGAGSEAVKKMRARNSISARWWPVLLSAALSREVRLTGDDLIALQRAATQAIEDKRPIRAA